MQLVGTNYLKDAIGNILQTITKVDSNFKKKISCEINPDRLGLELGDAKKSVKERKKERRKKERNKKTKENNSFLVQKKLEKNTSNLFWCCEQIFNAIY